MVYFIDRGPASGKSTINSWEKGVTKPRPKFLSKLSEVLGVEKEFLEFGSPEQYIKSVVLDDFFSDASRLDGPFKEYLKAKHPDYDHLVGSLRARVENDYEKKHGFYWVEDFTLFKQFSIDASKAEKDGLSKLLADYISGNSDSIIRNLGDSVYQRDELIIEIVIKMLRFEGNFLDFEGKSNRIKNCLRSFMEQSSTIIDPNEENFDETYKLISNMWAGEFGERRKLDHTYESLLMGILSDTMERIRELDNDHAKRVSKLDNLD
ncbi:transcriptional regulator [Limosilactobacillus fermentum]|nr:transcriptional regulator [Limosilactobacillus fermentum]